MVMSYCKLYVIFQGICVSQTHVEPMPIANLVSINTTKKGPFAPAKEVSLETQLEDVQEESV